MVAQQDGDVAGGLLDERAETVQFTDLGFRCTPQVFRISRIVRLESGRDLVSTLVLVVDQITEADDLAAPFAQRFGRLEVRVTDRSGLQRPPQLSPLTVHVSGLSCGGRRSEEHTS